MSYSHRVRFIAPDVYEISWIIDRKVQGSRLRWPSASRRFTDRAGARRFIKKHKVPAYCIRDGSGNPLTK